jgi:hypothetical protein
MTVLEGAVDATFAKPGSLRCAAVAKPCDPLRPLSVEIGQEHHQETDRWQ